jgi:hypothetical protein
MAFAQFDSITDTMLKHKARPKNTIKLKAPTPEKWEKWQNATMGWLDHTPEWKLGPPGSRQRQVPFSSQGFHEDGSPAYPMATQRWSRQRTGKYQAPPPVASCTSWDLAKSCET